MSKVVSKISETLGLSAKPPKIDIPEAQVPAAPAPNRREDTGATIIVGADASKDQRVSGGSKSGKKSSGGDVLGNLGRGGLSI